MIVLVFFVMFYDFRFGSVIAGICLQDQRNQLLSVLT